MGTSSSKSKSKKAKDNKNFVENDTSLMKKDEKVMRFLGKDNIRIIYHKNDGLNDYIIEMYIDKRENKVINNNNSDFIFILDKSGSMDEEVHRIISSIFPKFMKKLNYSDNFLVHLITFDDDAYLNKLAISYLKNDNTFCGSGGTSMRDAFKLVKSIIQSNIQRQIHYRILALSDGMIGDQNEAAEAADDLLTEINNNYPNLLISAGSVLYISNCGADPDSSALSKVLSLGSMKNNNLTEVNATELSDEEIAEKLYNLFKDDGCNAFSTIKSNKIKFRVEPWKQGTNEVELKEGRNIVYCDKDPSKENIGIYEDGKLKYKKIDFSEGYKVSYSTYNDLLGAEIKMIGRKVKINKVSGTKAALEENKKIIDYYENFEKKLQGNETKELISGELKRSDEVDITKFDNKQKAQFIGIDGNCIPMNQLLAEIIDVNEEDKKDADDFARKTLGDFNIIGKKLDQIFGN